MRSPGYRPATVRDLLRLLRIDKSRRNAFKRILRDMVSEEEIVRVDRVRYALDGGAAGAAGSSRTRRALTGRLQIHPRGFGFVTPEEGGRDVFIPPPAIGDLMDGDRVAVRIVREGREGRALGEVIRVIERSRRRVLGVYRAQGGRHGPGTVEAYDRRFASGILIAEGDTGGARNGLVVGVEITRPPGEGMLACGRVVEVLGSPDEPGMDLRTIVRKYDLREEFPPAVLEAAERIPEEVPEVAIRGREDFRDLPIVTIDGETAKDFDDAVFVRRNTDGTYELQVHIADVAHYIPPSGPLDAEAYERGTSVYFPGTAIPMLPPRLSNGICSLNPGVDRLVQSCLMTIDRHGRTADYRLIPGVIRSAARMTYTNVAKILVDRDPAVMERYRELVPVFRLMEEVSSVLNASRCRRGSIDFDLPEPEVILAATGEMTGIVSLERNVAHRLIEEFMLAANETVARHLWRARMPSLYRVHERPEPRRLEEFDTVARAFGYRLPRPFTSIEPAAFQSIVEMMRGRPEERFLSRLMLRSMKQARYQEKRDIHFGLASRCYTHFTSPIRRYPDLIVHRLLGRASEGPALTQRERAALEGFLPEAGRRSSLMERNADAAENELIEWKKMAFMSERLGEEFDGFIIGVQQYGFFVELRDLFIEGLVPVEALIDDDYRFIEKRQILKGEGHGRVFKIGDPVRVRVDRVNQFALQVDFSLVEPRLEAGRAQTAGRGRTTGRRRAAGRGRTAGRRGAAESGGRVRRKGSGPRRAGGRRRRG